MKSLYPEKQKLKMENSIQAHLFAQEARISQLEITLLHPAPPWANDFHIIQELIFTQI